MAKMNDERQQKLKELSQRARERCPEYFTENHPIEIRILSASLIMKEVFELIDAMGITIDLRIKKDLLIGINLNQIEHRVYTDPDLVKIADSIRNSQYAIEGAALVSSFWEPGKEQDK